MSASTLSRFMLLSFVAVFTAAVHADSTTILQPGTEAPSFSLPSTSGKRVAISVYCGKKLSKPYLNEKKHIVILSFWATWCVPCRHEIPILQEFARKHQEDAMKIFLVNIDGTDVDVAATVKRTGYTLPVLLDPYKRTAGRYGVRALPSLFVIDPEGIIRLASTGYDESTDLAKQLEDIILEIQGGARTATNKKSHDCATSHH